MLSQQITTTLNLILATNNARFEQMARQMDRITKVINLDENPQVNDAHTINVPTIENLENPEINVHIVRRGQNADNVLCRVQNNIEGIKISIKMWLRQSNMFSIGLDLTSSLLTNHFLYLLFSSIFNKLKYPGVRRSQNHSRSSQVRTVSRQWNISLDIQSR